MKNVFTIILTVLAALIAAPSVASGWSTPESVAEQEAMVAWVTKNSVSSVDERKSRLIVADAYEYAQVHNLDVTVVLAVMRVESNFDANASHKHGSRGLMQVIPYWHRDKLKGRNVMNPRVNVEVGTQVLADCSKKAKGHLLNALSCYSGGQGKKYYQKVVNRQREILADTRTMSLDFLVQHLNRSSTQHASLP
ncbi:Transglycosylase SLT domain protein [compost metagenome]